MLAVAVVAGIRLPFFAYEKREPQGELVPRFVAGTWARQWQCLRSGFLRLASSGTALPQNQKTDNFGADPKLGAT